MTRREPQQDPWFSTRLAQLTGEALTEYDHVLGEDFADPDVRHEVARMVAAQRWFAERNNPNADRYSHNFMVAGGLRDTARWLQMSYEVVWRQPDSWDRRYALQILGHALKEPKEVALSIAMARLLLDTLVGLR